MLIPRDEDVQIAHVPRPSVKGESPCADEKLWAVGVSREKQASALALYQEGNGFDAGTVSVFAQDHLVIGACL